MHVNVFWNNNIIIVMHIEAARSTDMCAVSFQIWFFPRYIYSLQCVSEPTKVGRSSGFKFTNVVMPSYKNSTNIVYK